MRLLRRRMASRAMASRRELELRWVVSSGDGEEIWSRANSHMHTMLMTCRTKRGEQISGRKSSRSRCGAIDASGLQRDLPFLAHRELERLIESRIITFASSRCDQAATCSLESTPTTSKTLLSSLRSRCLARLPIYASYHAF